MKLHKPVATAGVLALLALGACQPKPSAEDAAQSSAVAAEAASFAAGRKAWLEELRKTEAAAIAAQPGVAARSGETLTITLGGKAVARFTDKNATGCVGDNTCSVWRFDRTVELQVTPGGVKQTFAVLSQESGEVNSVYIVGGDGDAIVGGSDFTVSPDGRFLAFGIKDEGVIDGFLGIVDFASPGHDSYVYFDLPCEPGDWTAARQFNVTCSAGDGYEFVTTGSVRETAPGTWTVTETTQKMRDADQPPAKPVPLRTVTAKMAKPEPSPDDKAGEDEYNRNIGYERLISN